jgi:hypothetical protein
MAKKETFKIKAAKGAPDLVAHGNCHAEKKGGYYETDNAKFADFVRSEYGVDDDGTKPARPAKSKKKTKAAKAPTVTAPAAPETQAGTQTEPAE